MAEKTTKKAKESVKNWLNQSAPLVSVLCLVYNHKQYLRQCFDGFLMQRVNFSFEVIVHDDASTDGSAAIINEYHERYPSLFVPILQRENQFSRHVPITTTYMLPCARGKYIAFCEGDDYWIDPEKLQKQVDFMEAYPDYSMCIHGCRLYDNQTQEFVDNSAYMCTPDTIGILDLFGQPFQVASSSLFFRRNDTAEAKRLRLGDVVNVNGDTVNLFLYAEQGKIKFLPQEMSVYRLETGLWSTGNWYSRDLTSLISLSKLYSVIDNEDARCMIDNVIYPTKQGILSRMQEYYRVLGSKPYLLGQKILRPLRKLTKR